MAEVAGLVIGAVALLSTFKDCIELFSDISAAKSLGSDYELLNTKLDIEKTLLLQWAERVRLFQHHDYDQRLDDPVVNKTVSSILAAVQRLLSESSSLQQRYGLKRVDTRTTMVPAMSGPRMNQFLQDFQSLNLQINATQKDASVKRQFCWVVRDKDKFTVLVRELSTLVAKLNEVIPITHPSSSVDAMTRKDLESIRNLRQLQLVLDAAKGYENIVADLAEKDVTVRCQERVLERLWYRKIEDRRNNVADAHTNTLNWVLHPPSSDVAWDDLSEWLRTGSDVYWISGKAGSGKSTLMKYCYGHPETRRYLEQWAGDRRLIMADFFFWHLGAPEQKSFEGLSRGLLYSVLNSEPTLIKRALPSMWREAHRADKQSLDLPSESEMSAAFSAISHATTTERFCFFIDGLDEYSGNYLKGIDFLNSLVSSGNLKVLVSSRPIPACYQAFSAKKKLQLEDLTREDITIYVHNTIGTHPYTKDLVALDPGGVEQILQDLINKASGVFLWVVLACRSLLEGFAAFDYLDELQRRVDELPPELESLFTHMLERIEPRYLGQAAKLLRICFQRRMHPESEPVYTLGLALVDENHVDNTHSRYLREIPLHERQMKCRVLEARLRSRCCGLLEVQQSTKVFQPDRCFCGHMGVGDPNNHPDSLVDSTVQFIHRSVFEFLNSPGVWDLNCLRIDDSGFEADAVLCKMNLHLLCISAVDEESDDCDHFQINEIARDCLLCAKYSDSAFGEATPRTLLDVSLVLFEIIEMLRRQGRLSSTARGRDCCVFFLEVLRRLRPSKKARLRPSRKATTQLALLLAVELGMVNIISHWESMGLFSQMSESWPFLYHAISRPLTSQLPYFGLEQSPETVSLLLLKGCDPNQIFVEDYTAQRTTPWKSWVTKMQSSTARQSGFAETAIAEITMHFLKAGADLDVAVSGFPGSLESIIRQRILGSQIRQRILGSQVYAEDPGPGVGLSRDERALASLCDGILDFIVLRRAASDTNTPVSGPSLHAGQLGPETSTTGVSSASGLMEGNVRGTSRRRPRPEPETESDGGVGDEAGSAMKRRRCDVVPTADKFTGTR